MSLFTSDLLRDYGKTFVFLDKKTTPDGYGGYVREWTEGAEFQGIPIEDVSMDAQVAGVQNVTTFGQIKTAKNVPLEYHSVIKEKASGKTYRVKKEGMTSPSNSKLDMALFEIEEYTPTDG